MYTELLGNIFLISSLFGCSCLISGVFIGNFLQKYIEYTDEKFEEFKEYINYIPYEERYLLEEADNDDYKLNNNSFVMENTPHGLVIMKYDDDEEGFIYWSNKNINYVYLETVARKFTKLYKCKNLYIDRNRTLNNINNNENENTNKKSEQEEKKSTTVNRDDIHINDEHFIPDKKKEEQPNPFATFKKNIKKKTNIKHQKNGCKFIHKGKINEFSILKKEYEYTPPKENITFDIFKKMLFGKN